MAEPPRHVAPDCVLTGWDFSTGGVKCLAFDLDGRTLAQVRLPTDLWTEGGVSELNLMQLEVERARNLFHEGLKLRDMVSPRLALHIELFGRCGLEVLHLIERVGYDVFRRRPTLSRWNGLKLLARCWWSNRFSG